MTVRVRFGSLVDRLDQMLVSFMSAYGHSPPALGDCHLVPLVREPEADHQ